MKFRAEDYDQRVGELLDELVDAKTIAELGGGEAFAREAAAALLGIQAGTVVELSGDWVITPEPAEEIDRLVKAARDAKAQGISLIDAARMGLFEPPKEA